MSNNRSQLELRLLSPGRVAWCLIGVVAALAVFSLVGQIARFWFDHPHMQGFVPAFYLDYESNVPTWYSSFTIMLSAALTAVIAWGKCAEGDTYRRHWCFLAIVLFAMSIDEVAMFHEYPIHPLREAFGASGLLYYTWVVPAGILITLFAAAYWRFIWHLPKQTRNHFMLAATIFLSGAIGVEMLSGVQADLYGEENMGYALITTVEEVLEMLGIVVLIAALLHYLPSTISSLKICVSQPTTP